MDVSGNAPLQDEVEGLFWLTAPAACLILDAAPTTPVVKAFAAYEAGFHVLTCPWFAGRARLEIRR